MSLFAQKSRPEMVATIYGSSQAQLSERLGIVRRCDARFTAGIKKPRYCEALDFSISRMALSCPLHFSIDSSSDMFKRTLSPNVIPSGMFGTTQSIRRFPGIGGLGTFMASRTICCFAHPDNTISRNKLNSAFVVFECTLHLFL